MRLLIVEDEIDILQGIRDVVEQCPEEFEAVFAAGNAEQALGIIEAYKPEIILTDIMLPEMTGLDMLEKVKELAYEPKVVVISSYNNFTYAQRSMQLGAIDYILKPIRKDELSDKIRDVHRMIRQEHLNKEKFKDQTVYARLGTETLKERFVLGLCLQRTSLTEHIHHRLQVWNLSWLALQPFVLISLRINRNDVPTKQDKDIELENFAVGNIAEEILQSYPPSVLIRNVHRDWIVLTAWEDELDLVRDIREKVLKYQKLHLSVGMSEKMFAFQSIAEAYGQAQQALKMSSLSDSQPVARYPDMIRVLDSEAVQIGREWVSDCLLEGEVHEAGRSLEAFIRQSMLSGEVRKPADIAKKCLEWMLEIHACLKDKLGKDIHHFPLELWEKLDRCLTVEEMKELLRSYLDELADAVAKQQPNLMNFNIDKAKRIINERYREPITLQHVADELCIHPVWLSRLFKKITGQNFLDYLTEIRMEEAKHMLRHSSIKIYEIAELIGYQEIQYFGKLFKKRTGLTPKEYRYGKYENG